MFTTHKRLKRRIAAHWFVPQSSPCMISTTNVAMSVYVAFDYSCWRRQLARRLHVKSGHIGMGWSGRAVNEEMGAASTIIVR